MANMWISYEKRRGVNGDLDHEQVFFACHDAYEKKDTLKEMGFRFNSWDRTWVKKTTDEDFMTLFARVVVACELTYDDVYKTLGNLYIPASIQGNAPEASALEAYNNYMDAHPEWF